VEPRSWRIPAPVSLAVQDWGGDGAPVLLAHPTGFHGTVWRPVATRLVAAGRHVFSFDFRGHGESDSSPSGYAWDVFADDVRAVVDALGLAGEPTLLPAGHSKGGAAFLLAEAAAPGTFPCIWCYEPIVIPGEPARLDDDDPLVRSAVRRRETWDSREAALAAFSSRPPLDVLDPDALRAYVERGFRDLDVDNESDGGGVALRCRPEDEAEMYALRAAHDAWRLLPQVRCPVHVVCGDATDAMTPRLCERVVGRLPNAILEVLPGLGHFGPLQDPDRAVESMLAFAPAG
jgi:pimeloyl-ACP methyl ester carboxylesterase